MLDMEDRLHITLMTVLDFTGIFANLILIAAIRARTPKSLSAYAVILFANACVDVVAAFCSWYCTIAIVYEAGVVILIYVGPCTLIGVSSCHASISLYADTVVLSTNLLLISFAYRLWSVRHSTSTAVGDVSVKRKLSAICILSMIPMSLNSICIHLSGTYPNSTARMTSYLNMTGRIPSTDNLALRFAVVFIVLSCSIGFAAILFLRRSLVAELAKIKTPSHHNERKILRTLTIQMMLPIAYIVGIVLWLLGVTGVVKSTAMGRSVLISTSFVALLTPIVTIYYLPTYRRYACEIFACLGICPVEALNNKTSDLSRAKLSFAQSTRVERI